MASLQDSLTNFRRALNQLESSAGRDFSDPTLLAGFLKHFELTFETCWKALRAHLGEKLGIEASSPRAALEKAYQNGVIQDEMLWLGMIKDRNASVHLYSETDARALAVKVRDRYVPVFKKLSDELKP